ncbi:hypothetical protein MUK51_03155 [Sphingobacterium faecium]|uniref:hypothetical protein n=2 Tax=Sphingobacterium faecium TaxID=34087 RepID=UPI0021B5A469|nr:hypothetical protein [Sphingobacterium faecium]UXD70292.1 hypothetical protein MUK51_03155 [Sphingobacterium faecium]
MQIYEELANEISIHHEMTRVAYHNPKFSLTLYLFICKWKSGNVTLAEHIQANSAYRRLQNLDLPKQIYP